MGINEVISASRNKRKMVLSIPLKLLPWKTAARNSQEMYFLPRMQIWKTGLSLCS